METFERLINLFNALQDIRKLVKKFEKKWYMITYAYDQVGITYFDLNIEKRIIDEIFYNTNNKTLEVELYINRNIITISLEDTKNYILFDICKKDFVLLNGKELNSSIYIKKDTSTLSTLVNNNTANIIILDDIFIDDKLRQILKLKNFVSYYSDIKSLFVNLFNDFINVVTNKYILSKTVIVTENDFDNDDDEDKKRKYIPLFGYFISFNIYDDVCKTHEHLSESFTNDLKQLKKDIFKQLLEYDIISNYDYFNLYAHKNIHDQNNCYITFEISFDFKDILDIILLIDILQIVQKI
ncbi:MAG: hypothetical protein QXW35_05220 [Candidatus Aenigmatarchaeota archaeon]